MFSTCESGSIIWHSTLCAGPCLSAKRLSPLLYVHTCLIRIVVFVLCGLLEPLLVWMANYSSNSGHCIRHVSYLLDYQILHCFMLTSKKSQLGRNRRWINGEHKVSIHSYLFFLLAFLHQCFTIPRAVPSSGLRGYIFACLM